MKNLTLKASVLHSARHDTVRMMAALSFLVTGFVTAEADVSKLPDEEHPDLKWKIVPVSDRIESLRNGAKLSVSGKTMPIDGKKSLNSRKSNDSGSVEIFGNLCYSDSWGYDGNEPIGFYKFKADASYSEALFLNPVLMPAGGGVVVDDHYHFVAEDGMGNYTYYVYSFDGTRTEEKSVDITYVAADLTYDKTTDRIYGCFYNSEASGFELAYINPVTLERYRVGDFSAEDTRLVCIAATFTGELYGVGLNGILYKIDKDSGEMTYLSDTGITPAPFVQSAVVNPVDGLLYWQAITYETTDMVTVNLAGGGVKKIGSFVNNDCYLGLYIPGQPINADAPAKINDLSFDFTEGNLSGRISFTLPDALSNGNPITGNVNYRVLIDGDLLKEGSSNPAEQVNIEVTLPEGSHLLEVCASNEAGDGESTSIRKWVGNDVPADVTDLKAQFDKDTDKVTLSWTPVTSGAHEGWIEPAEIKYDIYQQPADIKIASDISETELTFNSGISLLEHIYFEAVAKYKDKESEHASSNPILVGDHVETPYFEDFSDLSHIEHYKFIDANGDGNCWDLQAYDMLGNFAVMYTYMSEADDWLVSPPIKFGADRNYSMQCVIASMNPKDHVAECIDVYVGQGDDLQSYQKIDESQYELSDLEYGETALTVSDILTPENEGMYRIAVHAKGFDQYNYYFLKFRSLSINDNVIYKAPEPPAEFKVTPYPKGEKMAKVSLVCPQKDNKGEMIDKVDYVEIYRDNQMIRRFDNPVPGTALSFDDNMDNEESGIKRYHAVAANSYGCSLKSEFEVYVGVDVLASPSEVKAYDKESHILIKWNPVKEGASGGYVDTDGITYTITDRQGNIIASELSGCEYSYAVEQPSEQIALQFNVNGVSGGLEGGSTKSNPIIIGESWKLPFYEPFTGGVPVNSLWWVDGMDGYYRFGMVSDYGCGDEGTAYFHGFDDYWSSCASGKISLDHTNSPMLQFAYESNAFSPVKLHVQVSDSGNDYETISTINLGQSYDSDRVWQHHSASLDKYKDSRYITLRFLVECYGDGMILIDDISVNDQSAVESVDADRSVVTVKDGCISISDVNGENIYIYDAKGILIKEFSEVYNDVMIPMSAGIYIVRIGERSCKIALK